MIALVILAAIGVYSLVVLAFCRAAAPKTDEERRYDDEQQLTALAKTARGRGGVIDHSATPATGYTDGYLRARGVIKGGEPAEVVIRRFRDADECDPHGIERPSQDVLRRAGLS